MADDGEAREVIRTWARGLTDEDIERLADDTAKVATQYVAFAEVLGKIKQAHDSGLGQVVLSAPEINSLMWGLRTLTSKKNP